MEYLPVDNFWASREVGPIDGDTAPSISLILVPPALPVGRVDPKPRMYAWIMLLGSPISFARYLCRSINRMESTIRIMWKSYYCNISAMSHNLT